MKIGILATGIILLIIGAGGYGSLQGSASDCQSFVGQVGRTFSQDFAQKCSYVALGQVLLIIIAVIGLGILIYGAVAKKKSVFICGYCNFVTEIEPELYEHYERTHRETREREQKRYEQMSGNARSPSHYDILGVARNATQEEITKQYRKLVLVWHPDQNRTKPDAAEYFKIINEAYEVLKDKDRRREYDRTLGFS